jgi:hypothetical protein
MGNDFLFTGNWFEKKYRVKSDARYIGFKTALNLIHQGRRKPHERLTIVETGTTRLENDWGAGMSTVLFGDYLKHYGGKLYTVDIEPRNIELCKKVTEEFKDNIEYVVGDSVEFLKKLDDRIDLLYLDSIDYPYGEMLNDYGGQADLVVAIEKLNAIPNDIVAEKYADLINPSQEHQLNEYRAAKTKLCTNWSVILLDDNDLPGGGKCRLTKQELLKDMFVHVLDFQQSLWINL